MTLEGSLEAFSLPDIFQLLSFTKKTGALHITGSSGRGVVYFATGSVTGATSDTGRQALGRRLVGAGLVDDEQLAAAVERVQEDPGTGFGRALHDAGAVDDGVLHDLVTEQAKDAVFDLLRWSQGDFAFVDDVNPDDLGVALPVEDVITEGRARLEAWEALTRTVPSPDSVVAVTLRPGDETVSLEADEWALLALVDGRSSVADLVRVSGRGEFATVNTLASMAGRGLVAVRQPGDADDGVAALLRRQGELSRLEGRPEPVRAEPYRAESASTEPASTEPADEPDGRLGRPASAVPEVVPQRPEPLVPRQPDFPEEPVSRPSTRRPTPAASVRTTTQTDGSAAVATSVPATGALIERDPSVNKSLLLRLIAGVRGL